MKVYLPDYSSHAGRWIYIGYQKAWQQLGYDIVVPPPEAPGNGNCVWLLDVPTTADLLAEEYIMMAPDSIAHNLGAPFLEAAARSHKTFIFAQPNAFPSPWGDHPNFQCAASDETINALNQMDNVFLWTFGDVVEDYFYKWKKVHTVPLAYDAISYAPIKNENYGKYDICFVGGWADNGFNEKRKIMLDIFIEFKKSDLNCGFFVNKNLSHEQENLLLYNSKISLNIHDAYQRTLGTDTNERTFKSIGLNGIMISDKVRHLEDIFPNVRASNDAAELVRITREYLSLSKKELNEIKEENREHILDNHCYTNRVQQLLSIGEEG